MDIRQLTYFVHVAKEKSFTLASHKLHISQPALSKMIKNLENELGLVLLDRSVKVPKLTDAGENLLEHAQKILEAFGELSKSLTDTVNLKRGRVTVGIPPVIGTCYFPHIIAGFRQTFPEITFTMVEEGARVIQEKVYEGLIDVGVVITPVDLHSYEVFPVTEDQYVLIVHKDHPLASNESVWMEDLKSEPFVMISEEFMLHQHITDACQEAGYDPQIAFMTSQWDFIIEMVSLNQGISIIPRPLVTKYKFPLIKSIPIHHAKLKWEIIMITKKERYISHAMKEFIHFVQAEVEDSSTL